MNRPQGSRPVTLVGHSIGARLIFSCLAELAKRRESDEKAEMASTSILESEMKPPCEEDDDDVDWASTGASNNPFPVAATAAVKMSGNTTAVCDGKTNSSLEDEKKVHGKTMSSYGLIQDVVLLGVPVNTSVRIISKHKVLFILKEVLF